jgi:hypothetical protein
MVNLLEDVCPFMIISHRIRFIMRNISDGICGDNQTHILYLTTVPENHTFVR